MIPDRSGEKGRIDFVKFRHELTEEDKRRAAEHGRVARELAEDPAWRAEHVARFGKVSSGTSQEMLDRIIASGWDDQPWVREALEEDAREDVMKEDISDEA